MLALTKGLVSIEHLKKFRDLGPHSIVQKGFAALYVVVEIFAEIDNH